AGYSFSEAAAAGIGFEIDGGVGGLSFASVGGEWTDGESVSFFFQTTQPPLGPGPAYALTGSDASGVAIGPVPAPIPVPAGLPLLLAGLGALAFLRRR
ncbi:MAG: VPLPA-CTERM sorting domain-containing protein, partial [Pseudomonadota bacterium]